MALVVKSPPQNRKTATIGRKLIEYREQQEFVSSNRILLRIRTDIPTITEKKYYWTLIDLNGQTLAIPPKLRKELDENEFDKVTGCGQIEDGTYQTIIWNSDKMLVVRYASSSYFLSLEVIDFKKNDWETKHIISDYSGQLFRIAKLKNKADDNIDSNDNCRSPNDQSLLSCVDFEPVNTQVLCSLLDICEIHILNILQAFEASSLSIDLQAVAVHQPLSKFNIFLIIKICGTFISI